MRALTAQDLSEIKQLSAKYAAALGNCAAGDYAALFTADGYMPAGVCRREASRVVRHQRRPGRRAERLMALVQTEPFCADPNGRRGTRNAPEVTITPTAEGARGVALLGTAGRYQDVYVRTSSGWRFKSRSHTRPGQTPADAPPLSLSTQDEADIRQLSVRYAHALGLCHADDYAAVFTADGFYSSSEFTGDKHREMYGPHGGKIPRADMARFVMSEPQCGSDAPKAPRNPPTNITIVASSGGATASIPLGNGERYEDIYVKTADGWRIQVPGTCPRRSAGVQHANAVIAHRPSQPTLEGATRVCAGG